MRFMTLWTYKRATEVKRLFRKIHYCVESSSIIFIGSQIERHLVVQVELKIALVEFQRA